MCRQRLQQKRKDKENFLERYMTARNNWGGAQSLLVDNYNHHKKTYLSLAFHRFILNPHVTICRFISKNTKVQETTTCPYLQMLSIHSYQLT